MPKEYPLALVDCMARELIRGNKSECRLFASSWRRVGRRVWIREAWRPEELTHVSGYRFRADNAFISIANTKEAAGIWCERWNQQHPSWWESRLTMPRDVCRQVYTIKDVWTEHIQDITEEGAEREGMAGVTVDDLMRLGDNNCILVTRAMQMGYTRYRVEMEREWATRDLRERFRTMIELMHGPEWWDDNNLVSVLCLTR